MNEVELETLVANLEGDGSSYEHMLDQAQHSVDKAAEHVEVASKKIEHFGETMRGFTEKAVAAVEIFGAGDWFKEAFSAFEHVEEVHIRLNAVLTVEAGQAGSLSRWGPRRIIRLDAVDPTVAAAIRALVAADQAARKEATLGVETSVAASEVHGDARPAD